VIEKNIANGVAALVVFVLAMAAIGLVFEAELVEAANGIVNRIGFAGLCAILLINDMLVTPFPGDLLLVVIAKSDLAENWFLHVLILGLTSVCAGLLGWSIGRWLGHLRFVRRLVGQFKDEHQDFIRKYGFLAVALGSATPLPYSLTCWSAGIMEIRWTTVLAASLLFRVPRFLIYYSLIVSAGSLFG
jgi:membrane protein YqaA with SNARE-associated domain